MTTMNQSQSTNTAKVDLKQYADTLLGYIQQLRSEQKFTDSEPISVYVTNTEIMRSLLKQYRDYIEQQGHIADLVQINPDAGNPMPENLAKKEFDIGDQAIIIGIDKA